MTSYPGPCRTCHDALWNRSYTPFQDNTPGTILQGRRLTKKLKRSRFLSVFLARSLVKRLIDRGTKLTTRLSAEPEQGIG